MSKIHVLEANSKGEYTLAIHTAVPTGNNSAGKTWQSVIKNEGTVLTVGFEPGQILQSEQDDIDSGALVEIIITSGQEETPAAITEMADRAITEKTAEFKKKYKWFGQVFASLLIGLVMSFNVHAANITKTADIVLISHQAATHPVTIVGSTITATTDLATTIFMFHGFVEAATNTNPGVFHVQISASASNNEDWVTIASFFTSVITPVVENMTATEASGETVLVVASTTGFIAEEFIYINDVGTLADSEWARVQEIVTDTSINIVDGLTTGKDTSDNIYDEASLFIFQLDLTAVTRYRVVYMHEGGTGANADIKVTAVEGDSIG